MRDYAGDTDWTNAFGDRFQGKKALRDGLEFIFNLDFVMAGDSADNAFEDVTFLSTDIAMVRPLHQRIQKDHQRYANGCRNETGHAPLVLFYFHEQDVAATDFSGSCSALRSRSSR